MPRRLAWNDWRVPEFPSMKASALLGVLLRQPLGYVIVRQKGSHRILRSENYPQLLFSFHDGVTVPPGLVRKYLVNDIGLSVNEALRLLGGK
ncbi:type II toxin-antitoxin system HicA family toxin [Streptomyces sp. NPDC058876]|uniref:type II toxin-antitoxin system HicA family toxin n=2 Tax=Streptomyces TaxID=1883 RepID=UPI0036B03221